MNFENYDEALSSHLIHEITYFTVFSILKRLIENGENFVGNRVGRPMLLLPNSTAFWPTLFSGSRDSYSVFAVVCCM